MNYFSLMRDFWDFAFENPERIKPNHCAIFCFAVEHCNRLGWKEKFGFPSGMAMDAVGMKCYNSYIKAFNDLVDFGFFHLVEKSRNQWSSNTIALSKFDKALDRALDKAIVKHSTKQSESTEQSTEQSTRSIIRPIYQLTNIPNNQFKEKNKIFISELKESEIWLEAIQRQNKIASVKVIEWLDLFELKLETEMTVKNSKKDLTEHFARWLPIELKKLEKAGINIFQKKELIGGI
jgi:hypothetical protein